jgi:excisionase family DNA binding protein
MKRKSKIIIKNDYRPIRIPLPSASAIEKTQPLAVCQAEAAKLLNISTVTLRKITHEGKIQSRKVGNRKILYSIENIRNYINGEIR